MPFVNGLQPFLMHWVKETLSIDLRSLALFRITLAILLIADLSIRATSLRAHYTDSGVLPRSSLLAESYPTGPTFSLHIMNGTLAFQGMLFAIASVAALALLLGLYTRYATILSWLLLASLQTRTPIVLQGDDDIRRLLLFWGIFLPLGACWSLDSQLRQYKKPASTMQNAISDYRIISVGTVALLIQVILIYWVNAITKTDASWHAEGTAIYYALNVDSLAKPLGQWLLNYPDSLNMLSRVVVPFEFWAPWLLFIPWHQGPIRLALITAFILFHLGLGLTLALTLFAPTCIVAWIVFLPPIFWEMLKKPGVPRSVIQFRDAGQKFLSPAITSLKTLVLNSAPRISTQLPDRRSSILSNGIALGCLLLVLAYNYYFLHQSRFSNGDTRSLVPQRVISLAAFLRLDQKWRMFAPAPAKNDGWHIIVGTLKNSEQIDLLHGGRAVNWDKPPRLYASYENYRWRQLLSHISLARNHRFRADYIRYLQRQWNAVNPSERHLNGAKMYYVLEETQPDFQSTLPARVLLYEKTFTGFDTDVPVGIDHPAAILRKTTNSSVTTPHPDGVPRIPREHFETHIKTEEKAELPSAQSTNPDTRPQVDQP